MEINGNIKFEKYRIYNIDLKTIDENEEIKQSDKKLNLKMRLIPEENKIVLFPEINYYYYYDSYQFTRQIILKLEIHFITDKNVIEQINENNAKDIAYQLLERSYFLIKNCLSSLISMDGMTIDDFSLTLKDK